MVHELREVVPVFFTVHWPSKPVPQSDFLRYVAVAEVAASAGGGHADHGGERKEQCGEARDGSASGGSTGPESESGTAGGVSVLNGAPRVRSGHTGGWSVNCNPAPP